jgi:hypothetical protein
MTEVLVKDREREIEFIRIVLCMAEIHVDYQIADLIRRLLKELEIKKGEFTIEDSIKILYKWKEDYRNYFDELKKKEKDVD